MNILAITLITLTNLTFVVLAIYTSLAPDASTVPLQISLYLNSLPDLTSLLLMFIALYYIKNLSVRADLKVMTLHAVILF